MSIYVSNILGRPVWNARGQQVGRCHDLLVTEREQGTALVRAVALQRDHQDPILVPAEQVAWLSPAVILKNGLGSPYLPGGQELYLRDQVLDRQIVDLEGRQLVRVNDLQLTRVEADGRYYLTGVAVGGPSLMRRLGLEGVSRGLLRAINKDMEEKVIPWSDVASVQPGAPIRLKVTKDKLNQINPVDIANMIAELDRPSSLALLQSLDTETVADAIQEIDPELQMSVLSSLPPEQAADVLEEMDPDDAADLLGALDEDERSAYLDLMETEDSIDVEKLLAFPEDSAGGIMTTEFTAIPMGMRARDALGYLRQSAAARDDETMYYLHVTDAEGRLVGIISLRDLVMAEPEAHLDEIMENNPLTVTPLTSQAEVAQIVARYNLLEVPVVDEEGRMEGIVTVDDAIDAVIPTAWKKRLPRFY
jgi:CBS domain-containing protein/sporulation protein YlmC with PRC-barrel domain